MRHVDYNVSMLTPIVNRSKTMDRLMELVTTLEIKIKGERETAPTFNQAVTKFVTDVRGLKQKERQITVKELEDLWEQVNRLISMERDIGDIGDILRSCSEALFPMIEYMKEISELFLLLQMKMGDSAPQWAQMDQFLQVLESLIGGPRLFGLRVTHLEGLHT